MNEPRCVCGCVCVSVSVRVSWMLHTPIAVRPIYLVLFRKPEYLSDSYYFLPSFSLSLPSSLYLSTFRYLTLSVCLFSLHFQTQSLGPILWPFQANAHDPWHAWISTCTLCVCVHHWHLTSCKRKNRQICVRLAYFITVSNGAKRDSVNFSSVFLTARLHCKSFSVKPAPKTSVSVCQALAKHLCPWSCS